jgi:hypothetical protein
MNTPNPAHSARIKCIDQLGNIRFLHYRNGWTVTLANGQRAELAYAGFAQNQTAVCKFALDDCQTPAEVLAVARRYGSSSYTLELPVKDVDDGPAPADHYRAVDATGSKMVWVPLPQPPTLSERLTAIVDEARAAGYAVAVLYPEELMGIDNEALQIHLVRAGKAFIDANLEPDEEG